MYSGLILVAGRFNDLGRRIRQTLEEPEPYRLPNLRNSSS